MGSTENRRKEVHYSGHVQGVGFRYTTQNIARDFDVTGFVQNLSDGQVLVVVEAEQSEAVRFLSKIREQLGEYIRDIKVADLDGSGEFNDFSIRY